MEARPVGPAPSRSAHHHATDGTGPAPLPCADWLRGGAGRDLARAAVIARGWRAGGSDGARGAGDRCERVSAGDGHRGREGRPGLA